MKHFFTSYYANIRNIPDDYILVSISGDIPDYLKERVDVWDRRLAPNLDLFTEYKNSPEGKAREIQYIKRFKNEVLDKRDLNEIIESWDTELLEDKSYVILCYETPDDFCHRQIVAEAIEEKYKIEVPEISLDENYERLNYKYIPKANFTDEEW